MRNVLLSIGVSRYLDGSGLESIPCAVSDAVLMYDTLKDVLGGDFDESRSVVASDLSSSEVRALVESRARGLLSDDRLIVYFSGHAESSSKPLALLFADADDKRRGRVLVSELASLTRFGECIYILDCCFSGEATAIANNANAFDSSRISVLAASSGREPAQYGLEGSPFTNVICRHARSASLAGGSLGLNELARLVNSDAGYEGECRVNVREGKSDVLLFGSPGGDEAYSDIAPRFLGRLEESAPAERETLWYMASALPLPAQGEIARAWAREGLPAEGGWLVRRAMGSFLSELPLGSSERKALTSSLLDSNNWMRRAVGLLGARRLVGIDEYREVAFELLTSAKVPMDVSWLASLHLADAGIWDLDRVIGSGLLNSSWGQIEAFEQLDRISCDSDTKLARLNGFASSCLASGTSCEGLATHFQLRNVHLDFGVQPNDRVAGDDLAKYLYRQAQRGRLRTAAGKWLLSALYGNWRGETRANLQGYAGSVRGDSLLESMTIMGDLPSVPLRMAILADSFTAAHDECREAALEWGLVDSHPWVRRVAIELAASLGREVGTVGDLDMQVFPGLLDLLITVGRSGGCWAESASVRLLTQDEVQAVRRDVEGPSR